MLKNIFVRIASKHAHKIKAMGRRGLSLFLMVATVLWTLGAPLTVLIPSAQAVVTQTVTPANFSTTNTIKVNGPGQGIKFTVIGNAGESWAGAGGFKYQVNNVNGILSSDGDFDSCVLIRDNGTGNDDQISQTLDNPGDPNVAANDDILAVTNGPNVSIGSVISMDLSAALAPAKALPTAATGTFDFAFFCNVSAAASNGDVFTISLASGGANDAYTFTSNDINATAFTSQQITVDTVAPTAATGEPVTNNQKFIQADTLVSRVFSEALSPGSVNTTNVTLKKCTAAEGTGTDSQLATAACATKDTPNLATSVTLGADGANNNRKISIVHSILPLNSWFEVSYGTGVTDDAENGLATAQVYRFKTSEFFGGTGGTNSTLPRVQTFVPSAGAGAVSTNANLFAQFPSGPEGNMKADGTSTAINNTSNVSLKKMTNGVLGSEICTGSACVLTWGSLNSLKLDPATNLDAGADYQFCVKGTAQNSVNIPLGTDACVFFHTGSSADSAAPALRATIPVTPVDGATGVNPVTSDIFIAFNEAIDPATLGQTTLCLDNNSNGCDINDSNVSAATLTVSSQMQGADALVRFTPRTPLATNQRYCFNASNTIKDLAGNVFAGSTNKCFTTAGSVTDPVAGAPRVLFAEADNFKVMVRFSEPVKGTAAAGANDSLNPANYTLVCPADADGVGPTINLTGKTIIYRSTGVGSEVEIQGLGLPDTQNCQITVSANIQDLANIGMDTTGSPANNLARFKVLSSLTTGGFLGSAGSTQDFKSSTNFATFWQNPQRCAPRANATSKATSVECEFPVPAALATGAKLLLTFPTGFTVTSAAAPAGSASYMNADINGPGPGTTTISNVSADNASGIVTVTIAHSGTPMGSTDQLRFELSGITTPSTASNDSRISIIVKDSTGIKQGTTINAAPFQIQAAGSLNIKGSVFKDTNSNGAKDAGEGLATIKVFCNQMGGYAVGSTAGGMMGFQEATTDAAGDYTFSGLTSGQYGCNLPPQTNLNNANVGGSSPFQNVSLASVSKGCVPASGRSDCVDFKFTDLGGAAAKTITVSITGAPASTEMDAFCYSTSSFQSSAPVMKALTTNSGGAGTSTGSTTLKLLANINYECGIGPHMAFESFGTGTAPPPPTFTFMPPRMQKVLADADKTVTFALTSTNRTITGSVVDGSSAGIANVYVRAEPIGCFDATSGEFKDCRGAFAQTKSDGTYTLNISDGVYEVGADGPGLPRSTREIASVKGANVTGVTLKMVKSSTTISGSIKDESSNGIKYAHVSGQRITSGGTCSSFTPAGGFADSPTDSSGNYTLYTDVGTWCVRAFAPSYGEIGNKTVVISGSTSQTGQDISATAAEYGTITGTVTSGGTAVTSGFINCFGSSGGNSGQIGSDGTFSLKVKTGTGYTCDGFVPGVGPLTRQTSVTITASTTTALGTIALGNPGTITVTATGISDGFCDARPTTGVGGSGAPLQAGTATLKVQAGTYTVRCGSPKTGEVVNKASVVVTAGGTATVAATSTLTTRTVVGQVTDGTNNLEGVTLKFDEKSSGRSFIVKTGSQSGATTDNLSATSIPEGTYKVTASKKGYEAATTTATVSGGNLDLTAGATALALTPTTTTSGETVNIPVDAADGTTDYTGSATVVATKTEGGVTKTVVGQLDATAGTAPLALTNGTWTLTATGDNGKTTASSKTIVIANGAVTTVNGVSTSNQSGADLDLTTNIGGKSDAQLVTLLKTESETVALSSGGLLTYETLAVGGVSPEINVPSSVLSTSDSSTGKVEMKADTTLAGIDPGADANFVGSSGYEITPKDANGNPITDISGSVTVTIPYTDADVAAAGVAESKLQFASFNTTSQTWETFPTTVDTVNNLLIASISHFSSFGIIGSVATAAAGSARSDSPISAVTNFQAVTDGTKVTLTWIDPTETNFNHVLVIKDGEILATQPVTAGIQKFVDTAVMAGKTYTYLLRARSTLGSNRDSATISIKVEAGSTPSVTAPAPTTTTTTTTTTTGTTTAVPAVVPAQSYVAAPSMVYIEVRNLKNEQAKALELAIYLKKTLGPKTFARLMAASTKKGTNWHVYVKAYVYGKHPKDHISKVLRVSGKHRTIDLTKSMP